MKKEKIFLFLSRGITVILITLTVFIIYFLFGITRYSDSLSSNTYGHDNHKDMNTAVGTAGDAAGAIGSAGDAASHSSKNVDETPTKLKLIQALETELNALKSSKINSGQKVHDIKRDIIPQIEELKQTAPKYNTSINQLEESAQIAIARASKQAIIENELKALVDKQMTFYLDDNMFLQKHYIASSRISLSESHEEAAAEIKQEKGVVILQNTLPTGHKMSMKLTGKNFNITPISEDVQLLLHSSKNTEWKWKIQPTESGNQSVELSAYAHIDIEGDNAPILVEVYKKDIVIQTGFWNGINLFAKGNWDWITAALIPLLLFGYKKKENLYAMGISLKDRIVQKNIEDIEK